MDDHHDATTSGSNAANQEEEEGVTADSYGSIDVSAIHNSCWMIKVPQKLCELWEAAEEGTQVGELIFTKGGTTQNGNKKIPPSLEVCVSEILAREHHEKKTNKHSNSSTQKKPPPGPVAASPATAPPSQHSHIPPSLPLQYRLEAMTAKVPTLHPFTRNSRNGSCTLTGTVTRTANLQVQRDDAYRQLLRNRLLHHTIQTKTFVKPADTTDSIVKRGGGSKNTATTSNANKKSFGNAVLQFGKRQMEASQEQQAYARSGGNAYNSNKQARHFSPDQSLRSVLFELFAQEPFWTVKDLKAAAVAGGCTAAIPKKAEAELRDMLKNELAVYHRSGDHKTKWELRPEFQQSLGGMGQSSGSPASQQGGA